MRTAALLVLLMLLALCPAPSRAADDLALLDGLGRSMAQVHSVQTRFVQEKQLAMLREPLRAEGRLYYQAPDSLRWEYTAPEASGFTVRGGKGRRWDKGQELPVDLARDPVLGPMAGELLAWVKFDLDHIRRAYAIEVLQAAPPLLRLRPRAPQLARVLESLDIAFAADGRSVLQVDYREADGDATTIRFSETYLDARLPEGLF